MKRAATRALFRSAPAGLGLALLLGIAPLAAAQRGTTIPQAHHGVWAYGSPRPCAAHAAGQDNDALMLIGSDAIGFWEGSYDIVAVRRTRRGMQLDVVEHGPGYPDAGERATVLLHPMGRDRIAFERIASDRQQGVMRSTLYRCADASSAGAARPGGR